MPWLLTAAQFLMRGVMQVIGWIFKQLLAFSPVPSGEPNGDPTDIIDSFSPAPTNPFWDQFFTVLVYIAATIATIGLIVLVILAIRKAVQLFNAILHNMLVQKGLLSSGDNTFEDTNESIIKLRDLPRKYYDGLKNRLSSLKNRKRWNDLTTESERVRYLYRHSLKRAEKSGYQHKQSYTPHEALGEASQDLPQIQPVRDDLSAAYDIARYAECEPPAGSAARMKKNSGL